MDYKQLPVYQSKTVILDALLSNQVIIVESPTGSGKTTQIPLILHEAGYSRNGIIGITQPRRIATLNVCSFIKKQLCKTGIPDNFCAYKMRFYDTTDETTRIKILTDGMLLQEIKADPDLNRYSVLMIDEAHERSLNIDFISGLLKELIQRRPELKIIISSATINTKIFSKFFNNAPIISINAKQFNVDIKYYPLKIKNDSDVLAHSICEILNVSLKEFKKTNYKDNKDTLVFLPGEFDIKNTIENIYEYCDYNHLQIYPLYGRMNKDEQEQVFNETQSGKMKVVLATNIAETSLTIDGIKTVIDSGLAKINFYNQYDFTSSLITKPVSKSSAMQRTGRAGRTSDGICYRLYSEEEFNSRDMFTQEEILRTDLSEVVLRMVDLGIRDFKSFKFITKPDNKSLESGEKTLLLLNAIDNNRNLTETGKLMVGYPLLPRHSKCIVSAIQQNPDMIKPVSICISFLSCKTPFILPAGEEDAARNCHRRFSSEYGDFIGYQFLYRKYSEINGKDERQKFCDNNYLDFQSMEEIVHVTEQLCEITRNLGIPVIDMKPENTADYLHKTIVPICTGLIQYICVNKKASAYGTLNTDEIYIHPGSSYFRNPPAYLVAGEIVLTTKMYARSVSPLKKEWIDEINPKLAESLKKKRTARKTVEKTKTLESAKTLSLFGEKYPVIVSGDKKKHSLVVIPAEQVRTLYRLYRKSSRRPKNINAAILFNGYYLNYDQSLYEVLSTGKCFDFGKNDLCLKTTDKVFYENNIDELKPYLDSLMKLSPLKKYKNRLGYIELVSGGHGVFIHVNKNFNEAINNTAYSLLSISDYTQDRQFSQAYNRIIRFLD